MKNVFFLWLKTYLSWKYLHPRKFRGNIVQQATSFTTLQKLRLLFGKKYTFHELFYSLLKVEAKCICLSQIIFLKNHHGKILKRLSHSSDNMAIRGNCHKWILWQLPSCFSWQLPVLWQLPWICFFPQISQILFPLDSQFIGFFIFKL